MMVFSRLRRIFSPPAKAPEGMPEFAVPHGTRVYAVGDIHGRGALLAKMLAAIAADARGRPAAKVIEVFLGDYVDRGLQSREVVDLLLAPPGDGHERVCLMGNHEEALLGFLEDPKVLRDWTNFGGLATLASYGVQIPASMSPEKLAIVRDVFAKNIPPKHLDFFRALRTTYQLGDYLFVHAGIMPEVPLNKQRVDDLLWIRDPFLRYEGCFEQYVVHGHTPLEAPQVLHHRANLDVSAAPVDSLCCLVIEGAERRTMLVTSG